MKRIVYLCLFVCILSRYYVLAQSVRDDAIISDSIIQAEEKKITRGDKLKAYSILDNVTILSQENIPDTITFNQHISVYPEGRSLSMGYLGNISSPWVSYMYFDRSTDLDDFVSINGYDGILYGKNTARWYDTKIPFSFLRYNKNFDSQNSESLVSGKIGSNFTKRFNLTVDFNYSEASGFYTNNRNKNVGYGISGYYKGERYKAYAFWGHNNIVQSENGGITDFEYISNPQKFSNGRIDISSREVPVRISDGELFNRVKNGFGLFSHSFSLGYWHTEIKVKSDNNSKKVSLKDILNEVDDDTKKKDSIKLDTIKTFVSFMDLSHTATLTDQSHRMISRNSNVEWEKLFGKAYINKTTVNPTDPNEAPTYTILPNDTARLMTLSNTLAVSINEGFRPWVKFGLSAYARIENSWVSQIDTTKNTYKNNDTYHSIFVGGRIDRNKGEGLRFNVKGEVGVSGNNLGAVDVEGDIYGKFKLWKEVVNLRLSGAFINMSTPYFAEHYHSTFRYWDKDLEFVRRLRLGGELSFDKIGLSVNANTETIHNALYWAENGEVEQYKKLMQILSLRVTENIDLWRHLGITADVAYQTTTNQDIIPLPLISARLNLFTHFYLARVLSVQIGLDSYWHTAFKAPKWDPTTMQFHNQSINDIGGKAPFMIAYANFKLKQGRFFIKMFNVGEYIFDPDRMSLYQYPYNPPNIEAGIILDLFN